MKGSEVKPGNASMLLVHHDLEDALEFTRHTGLVQEDCNKNLHFIAEHRRKEGRDSSTHFLPIPISIDPFTPRSIMCSRAPSRLHWAPSAAGYQIPALHGLLHPHLEIDEHLTADEPGVWGAGARQAQGFQPSQAGHQRPCPWVKSGKSVVL